MYNFLSSFFIFHFSFNIPIFAALNASHMQKTFIIAFLAALVSLPSKAQDLAFRMAASDIALDSADTHTLHFALDNISFFKDNEFDGEQSKGYSLPGLWVQPKVVWQPLSCIRLEAGCHALVYNGANKYPCYVYHDIGRWKGNQYQRGAHVLPFFRAQAQLKNLTFVLGDIYGGANHRVAEPLMNPEINLTQDPEMGFQLLLDLPRYELDAWLNWQSYIFEEDTHQEAFTVGLHQKITLNPQPSTLNPEPSTLNLYIPLDILIQHRGGEQDATDMGVQTITNGGIGFGVQWNTGRRVLRTLTAEVSALGCWQQSGELWSFDFGVAGSCMVAADFVRDFRAFAGLFYARDFVSLYGAPFYSTLSLKHEGGRFSSLLTPHVGVEWSHTFAKNYILGAKVDAYPLYAGQLTKADGSTQPSTFASNFSFGIYFRCHPTFLLKRF